MSCCNLQSRNTKVKFMSTILENSIGKTHSGSTTLILSPHAAPFTYSTWRGRWRLRKQRNGQTLDQPRSASKQRRHWCKLENKKHLHFWQGAGSSPWTRKFLKRMTYGILETKYGVLRIRLCFGSDPYPYDLLISWSDTKTDYVEGKRTQSEDGLQILCGATFLC